MPLQAPEVQYRLKNLKTVVADLIKEEPTADKKALLALLEDHYKGGKPFTLNELATLDRAVEEALKK